ncbi:hypothetical protein Tco_0744258 [Tanacetum coccineum]
MENEHELSYETLTRVYLGSYEHYKSVGAEVEHPEPGLGNMGGDLERLGAVLDESWFKVEVCGSVYGGGLAAADYGVKGKHVV